MRYVHAMIFFFGESLRIRKQFHAGWFVFVTEFPRMLWTFLRLEWEDERRHHGYAPVTVPKGAMNGFRHVGRGKLVRKTKRKRPPRKKS